MSRLPLRRSAIEGPVQHSAGIFQFGTGQLSDSVEALTLAGAMATAKGAVLSDQEFDVHTWLRREFIALGMPEDNAVPFTGHALSIGLYGQKSGRNRQVIAKALANLTHALVSIPGLDARSGEINPDAVSHDLRLLEGVVTIGHYQHFRAAVERGEKPTHEHFSSMAQMRGTATMVAILPQWGAKLIRAGHSRPLDLEAQRELGGLAKRVWVQLDAQAFIELKDRQEHEVFELNLDVSTYRALGVNHERPVDRKRYLTQALNKITNIDPTYTEGVVEKTGTPGVHNLRVTRCFGQTREKHLRAKQSLRLKQSQEPPM